MRLWLVTSTREGVQHHWRVTAGSRDDAMLDILASTRKYLVGGQWETEELHGPVRN